MGYSYSAQVVEVSVDEETGVVTIDKVWVATAARRSTAVEGQVQGSVWMGMGQAMSEETAYHEGLLITDNMLDYRVPTIQDSPPIESASSRAMIRTGRSAPRRREGSLAAFLPALTNAPTPSACASTTCRSRPTAYSRRWRSAGGARGMG